MVRFRFVILSEACSIAAGFNYSARIQSGVIGVRRCEADVVLSPFLAQGVFVLGLVVVELDGDCAPVVVAAGESGVL